MPHIEFKMQRMTDRYRADVWNRFNYLPETAGVYLLTDTESGLRYVGSSMRVRERAISYMNPNAGDYRKCLFNKINVSAVTITLLQDCNGMDISEVRACEGKWITEMNTFYPAGLNKATPSKGGDKVNHQAYEDLRSQYETEGACHKLLSFANRLSFYLDAVEATPINHTLLELRKSAPLRRWTKNYTP